MLLRKIVAPKSLEFWWYRFSIIFAIVWVFSLPLQAIPCKVVVYNLNNYSTKHDVLVPAKSSISLSAIEEILSSLQPDVLAVCEMGSRKDLSYLQRKLKKAGSDLPYSVWLDAPDSSRHLALLSRFPIEQNNSCRFVLTNIPEHFVKRGILDVTLRLEDNYTLRLVGSHLKSQKLHVGNYDSKQIRLAEAQSLASHIQQILKSSPHANLLVFGDFNDRPTSPTLKMMLGSFPSLFDLAPSDDRGDRWTYHFRKDDVYSRFDYLLASPELTPEIVKVGISHPPHWNLASDHRPLYLLISTSLP